MWFQVTDQPLFAVAGFWQPTVKGNGFTMVTCDPNTLVAPIHPKAMITILAPQGHQRWLTGTYEDVVGLQTPYDATRMAVRGPEFPTRAAERPRVSRMPRRYSEPRRTASACRSPSAAAARGTRSRPNA